ncbi:MAG: calcium/sodium antiporter [Alphaproteobacteria bacterium]
MPAEVTPVAMLAGGLVLLYAGGRFLVSGAVGLARHLGVSPLLIGIVIVAFGTSAPELFVSVNAVVEGTPEIAVGNVVGSNIANVMLVLALAALFWPIGQRRVVLRDGATMLAATGLFIWSASRGQIAQEGGYVLVGLLVIYIIWSWLGERTRAEDGEITRPSALLLPRGLHPGWLDLFLTVAGIAGLVFGARLIVDGGVGLAQLLGVSEAVIAISMIAVGTSLPELAAIGVAASRKHTGIVVGGIVGSNIFNVLSVLGITALVKPVEIAPVFMERDVWVMLGAALVLALVVTTRRRFGRIEGAILLAAYGVYIYALYYEFLPNAPAAGG